MIRYLALCLFLVCISGVTAYAQTDSAIVVQPDSVPQRRYYQPPPAAARLLDSVIRAEKAHQLFVADSLAKRFVSKPDPLRRNQFLDSMLKVHLYKGYGFYSNMTKARSIMREGSTRRTREQWVVGIIMALVIYMALLNRSMSKDIRNVLESFFNNRVLSQVSKEDNLLNSWAFVGLFILFGFTFGLFLYQLTNYFEIYYAISGVRLFLSFSLLIIVMFAVKLMILRFLGFVFNVGRLVSEYISILYLTYFNITFVFLPVSLCFSLMATPYIKYVLSVALAVVIIIFIWQYLRSSLSMISNLKFHKFYLFIYLCALEICPVLILIKALNN